MRHGCWDYCCQHVQRGIILVDHDRCGIGENGNDVPWVLRGYFSFDIAKVLNPETEAMELNIWQSLLCLGEVIVILLGELLLHYLDSTWPAFLTIFCLLLFLSGLMFYSCLE